MNINHSVCGSKPQIPYWDHRPWYRHASFNLFHYCKDHPQKYWNSQC